MIKISQIIAYILTKIYLFIFTNLYVFNAPSQPTKRAVLFAANHQSELDPFVCLASLPFNVARSHLPIYFMTANDYYFSWLRPFAWMLGCKPARANDYSVPYGIADAIECITTGSSYFIFPEGKRVTHPGEVSAKKGVYDILEETQAPLMLVKINWGKRVLLRRQLTVTFYNAEKDSFTSAQEILDKIYILHQ